MTFTEKNCILCALGGGCMDEALRRNAEEACVRRWVSAIRAGDAQELMRLTHSDTSYGLAEARAALAPMLDGEYRLTFDPGDVPIRRYWLAANERPLCAVRVSFSVRDGEFFIFGFDRLA